MYELTLTNDIAKCWEMWLLTHLVSFYRSHLSLSQLLTFFTQNWYSSSLNLFTLGISFFLDCLISPPLYPFLTSFPLLTGSGGYGGGSQMIGQQGDSYMGMQNGDSYQLPNQVGANVQSQVPCMRVTYTLTR